VSFGVEAGQLSSGSLCRFVNLRFSRSEINTNLTPSRFPDETMFFSTGRVHNLSPNASCENETDAAIATLVFSTEQRD
jgi:hypothetical protein